MKRWLALCLSLVLCLGLVSGFVSAAGLPFTDVPTGQWYYSDVKNAYDMSLINGRSETLFEPDGYLTYAEAVKLAACMNQRYQTGSVTLKNGEPWYQTYVDYCKQQGIISKDYNWNANATRAGYMEIFANALPANALAQINYIADAVIPDVPMSHPQAGAIYKLYRAGILQGNDAAHNCSPATNIRRCEVAAILTRMMDASKRIRFTMGEESSKPETEPEKTEPLKIVTQPKDTTVKSGEIAYMNVKAEGGKTPYQYQWLMSLDGGRKQWISVPGQTSATLTITTSEDSAKQSPVYRCMVTDKNGDVVYSDLASITVERKQEEEKTEPLKIIDQPDSVKANAGDVAEFFIEVEGGKYPYSFEWMAIDGQGGHATVEGQYGVQTTDDAGYGWSVMQMIVGNGNDWTTNEDFYCIVTDADGNKVTSNTFEITVVSSEFTVTGSYPARVKSGETAVLKVNVSGGTKPYKFVWMGYNADDYSQGFTTGVIYWRGVTISADGSTLTIDTSKCEGKDFKCDVTDANGNTQRVEFTFSVY